MVIKLRKEIPFKKDIRILHGYLTTSHGVFYGELTAIHEVVVGTGLKTPSAFRQSGSQIEPNPRVMANRTLVVRSP